MLDAALSIAVPHCVVIIANVWSRSGSWSERRRHGRSEGRGGEGRGKNGRGGKGMGGRGEVREGRR